MKNTDPKEHNPIRANLEKQFQQLAKNMEKAPENVKNDVFSTLDTLNLIADIADLFTVKFTQTESAFLDIALDDPTADSTNKENDV